MPATHDVVGCVDRSQRTDSFGAAILQAAAGRTESRDQEPHLQHVDYDVLSNLSEAQDTQLRITELGDRLRWSKSRTHHHLTRMHKRGLIEKRTDSDDGRVTLARLTSHGLQVIQDAAPMHVRSVRRHFIDLLTDRTTRI